MPIAAELKNPALETADIWSAYAQLQTYKHDIPAALPTSCSLDDVHARIGSPPQTTPDSNPRTVDGSSSSKDSDQTLKVLIEGVFEKERLLDLITGFVTFEIERGKLLHATRSAVRRRNPSSHSEEGRWKDRRRLAHTGLRQEPHDGVLRRWKWPWP